MGCPLTGVPDFVLAVFIIFRFFSKRNPILYHSPWALGAGVSLFLISFLEAVGVTSLWIPFLEFVIVLIIGIQIEHFVYTNTEGKALYWIFGVITFITISIGVFTKDPVYFEVGLLVVLGTAMMRFSSMDNVFREEIKFPLLASGAMAFLSAASLVLGFTMLSTFLYFGALVLLIITVAENIMGIT
jgi:hypothetical protein